MRALPSLLAAGIAVAAGVFGPACQTTAPPETPATSTSLAGPPPRGTVLQRAHDDAPLFPAKESPGGHDHSHHAAPAAPAPAPSGGGAP